MPPPEPSVAAVEPTVKITAISEQLGLLDLEVTGDLAGLDPAIVTVFPDSGNAVTVRMTPRGPAAANGQALRGRAMVGRTGHVRVRIGDRGPERLCQVQVDPSFSTPDWAKGAVWYQILPERFRNGNPSNDPRPQHQPGVFHKRWNAAWEVVEVDELEAARADGAVVVSPLSPRRPDEHRAGGQLYNICTRRRYGGDLQGVVEMLDSIRELGVDAIYLTPVFRAPSLHKYDAADYRHIDDTLGDPGDPGPARWHEPGEAPDPSTWTWTAADRYAVEQFIPRVRDAGMRVIFDGVWNHTGRRFWAFEDLFARGHESPYLDWYDAKLAPPFDEASVGPHGPLSYVDPGMVVGWRAWDGRSGGLPAFKQTRSKDLSPPVKQHIFDVTRRWMRPDCSANARGVDGWRLDVASDIGVAFWKDWRKHVKRLNPEALLIAEIWHPAAAYFGDAGFDGQMNYPLARPAVQWLSGEQAMGSEQLGSALQAVFCNHPAIDLVQMNLLGSHDTDRLVSRLANPGRPYDDGTPPADTRYHRGKPAAEAYRRLVLAAALLTGYLGSPMIFAGDEWGVFGGDDPDCRKPVPWPDLGPRDDPAEDAQPAIREQIAGWLRLRRDPRVGQTLRYGAVRHLPTGHPDVFAFERTLNSERAVVILNRGAEPFDPSSLRLGDAAPVHGDANAVTGTIPPISAMCFKIVDESSTP